MPATSVIPAVIDALVTIGAAAAPVGTSVYDGFPVTDDPENYVAIGIDDPDAEDWTDSADSETDWVGTGSGAEQEERGTVTCAAIAWNDSGRMKVARDAAFAMKDALGTAIRNNISLSVGSVAWNLGKRHRYRSMQTDDGAVALVLFDIYFLARL